ncbi:hypothetical protein BC939DRAFT_472524 [Gamsiella multidivaricata]|uniref:uncharacterized protein n=1 Tax=Gamsiella multidivaricata TaxID=101098 RepID=UPI002220C5D3|nr:uncharacterized protein BC939DRAFT_472524 [Gamsiella multidivaricata]KAG0368485.1 hypothetical protein BGZ54_001851 [Gamsiella multidivaricata]KAI7832281.1 hypothetical protein BC939DRAFT_472524 [Gamsiella multidivaricata]
MPGLCDLPLECLQIIIVHLFHDHDTISLARLLRVNKHICTAALPFLYDNPFCRGLHEPKSTATDTTHADRTVNSTWSVMQLVRLLLRFADTDTVTDLLKAAYLNERNSTEQDDGCETLDDDPDDGVGKRNDGPENKGAVGNSHKDMDDNVEHHHNKHEIEAKALDSSGINYLLYLQHFHSLEVEPSQGFLFRNASLLSNNKLQGYLESSGLNAAYHSRSLDLERNPYQSPTDALWPYVALDLRIQLTWALCSPVLEHIQSLVIPLSDIRRYASVIHQLKSLTDVTFLLDQKLSYPAFIGNQLLEDNPRKHQAMESARTETLDEMVNFVRTHTRLFPRQLASANCPDNQNWPGNTQTCPKLYMDQLLNFLPSLNRPRVINRNTWTQFVSKIETTDLSELEVMQAPCNDPERWFRTLFDQPIYFLQRCRQLKQLEIVSLGPSCFEWAKEETLLRLRWKLHHMEANWSSTHVAIPTERPLSPVPLEHVRLWCHFRPLGNELNNIMVGFSQTIRSIVIRGSPRPANFSPLPTGQGTELLRAAVGEQPLLKKLIVTVAWGQYWLAQGCVLRCPELEHFEMEDEPIAYSCADIAAHFSRLSSFDHAPQLCLKNIRLEGTPALTFQPELLGVMPLLETLSLGVKCMGGRCYIPSVHDLLLHDAKSNNRVDNSAYRSCFVSTVPHRPRKRPFWSWDWYLPRLQHLQLTGEFAWRFQFKMLVGCPNLESLILNMATQDDREAVVEPEEVEPVNRHSSYQQTQLTQLTPTPITATYDEYQHLRTIQIQDLLIPTGSTNNDDNHGHDDDSNSSSSNHQHTSHTPFGDDRIIRMLKLKTLLIHGRWCISDTVLFFLFDRVMPHLRTLSESQCVGFSAKGWLRATGRLADLKSAWSSRIVPDERLEGMGLRRYIPDPAREPVLRIQEEEVDGVIQRRLVVVTDEDDKTSTSKRPTIYTFNQEIRYVKRA